MQILINHLGYEKHGAKKAIINAPENSKLDEFIIIDRIRGEIKYKGQIFKSGRVFDWKNYYFWLINFSDFQENGFYYIKIKSDSKDIISETFEINKKLLEKKCLSNILFYFKAQRSSGRYDKSDCSTPFYGKRKDKVDVHGGWFDASGDVSKYLSHLSYSNYFNPQQTPIVVYNLLLMYELFYKKTDDKRSVLLSQCIIDEASYGGDFLVRMKDPAGYFYQTVFDQWSKKTTDRMICSYSTIKGIRSERYQAGYRQGAGVSIAALAKLSLYETYGKYDSKIYLETAINAFMHLEECNNNYLDNGKKNMIDDYCALLAATELYNATKDEFFLKKARNYSISLSGRIMTGEKYSGWWRMDDEGLRPYYHAAEAGMPLISLLRYLEIVNTDEEKNEILLTIRKALCFELNITLEVNNPFGYARQLIKPVSEEIRSSFFMPHKNETGYWWQGENARIASISAAAFMSLKYFQDDKEFYFKLKKYGIDQLDWILGLNPFDTCMLHGRGRNNPEYLDFAPNIPGGICNGITAGYDDENDIAFLPGEYSTNFYNNWRWIEQWIPHAAWYMLAVALYPIE